MNKYNKKVEKYLLSLYPKEKDRGQIKDLFQSLIELPGNYITPEGLTAIINNVQRIGYTDDFANVVIKIAQGVQYHNASLLGPYKDFSYVREGVYLDRNDILEICENVVNPRDKAMILGEFEGLHGEYMQELLDIRPEDITDDGVYIASRDEVFPASKELKKYLEESLKTANYIFCSSLGQTDLVKLIENGTVLKELSKGKASEARLIYQNLIHLCNALGFGDSITYRHIRNCGKKYYLDLLSKKYVSHYDTALKDNLEIRKEFFDRFGLKKYISLNKMMDPMNKLIPHS